jgi:hypothetical protein
MAAKKDAWYLGSRAESLALMYLTRRGDLKIERPSQDYGLDFMVVIPKGQAYSGRILGIETRAAVSARKTGKSAIALPAHIARGSHRTSTIYHSPSVCSFSPWKTTRGITSG